MSHRRSCLLVSDDGSYDPIPLPHDEIVYLGRGPVTKITDKRCSRRQVELTADTLEMEVKLKALGRNKTGYNSCVVEQNNSVTLKHGDLVELILGQYKYRVEFNPPPEDSAHLKRMSPYSGEMPSIKKHRGETDDISTTVSKPSLDEKWESIDNGKLLIFTSKGVEGRSKIAGYDIDGTIIVTKSGRVFPVDNNDWKIAFPEAQKKLKKLLSQDYKIVFFTNQLGISRGKVRVPGYKAKVEEIITSLGVPVQVFVSAADGIYRKPAPGMWRALVEQKNDGVEVDLSNSFYCGDAAGREANWAPKKKKDFSCSDRLFALNLGLIFYTPEEHFQGMHPARYKLPDFNPSALRFDGPLCDPPHGSITSDSQEVVLMVGFQGSGKTFFATTYLVPKGYVHINRDELGSWQKCISALETALAKGQSAVIDNTNPDKESRKRFIEVATKHHVPCRCFLVTTSIQHAKHNNKFRELTDKSHMQITDMIINSYKNKYEEPTLGEGFSAVLKINCVPKLKDPELKTLYQMYLLEK